MARRRKKKERPTVGEYITTFANGEPQEGYVTDLLSVQFVFRETLDGPPQYLFYTDQWETS